MRRSTKRAFLLCFPFIPLFDRTHFSNSSKFFDSSIPPNFVTRSTERVLSLTSRFDHSTARRYLLRSRDRTVHPGITSQPSVFRRDNTRHRRENSICRWSAVKCRSSVHARYDYHEERCEGEVSVTRDRQGYWRAYGRPRAQWRKRTVGPAVLSCFRCADRAATTQAVPPRMIVSALLNATGDLGATSVVQCEIRTMQNSSNLGIPSNK